MDTATNTLKNGLSTLTNAANSIGNKIGISNNTQVTNKVNEEEVSEDKESEEVTEDKESEEVTEDKESEEEDRRQRSLKK